MDILSYVLGYNKGKAQGGGGNAPAETDIFPLQTVEFAQDNVDFGGAYVANSPEFLPLKEGETYYVKWGAYEEPFPCVCKSTLFDGAPALYIGNSYLMGEGENSGEPFIIGSVDMIGATLFVTVETESSRTIRIYQKAGGGTSTDERVKYVTFMQGGTELLKYPVIVGDTVKNPVTAGLIEAPIKEPTVDTIYPFNGWSLTDDNTADSDALTNVTADRTVYAAFGEEARKYTVNFYDGDTLIKSEQVAYGGSSTYEATKEGYFLASWLPEPTNITEDMDCYAQWIDRIEFAEATWAEIEMVSNSGYASKMWAVGDKKTITIGSATREIVIIGFDMDKDANDNTVGITMTIADNPYPTTLYDINYVDDWKTSEPQVAIDNAFSTLPADLQAVIKPVKKTFGRVIDYGIMGGGKKYTTSTATRSLWQFDAQELGSDIGNSPYTLTAYPYFSSDTQRKFGNTNTGSATTYQYSLRSYFYQYNNDNRVAYVNYTGQVQTIDYNSALIYALRFGFCI